MTMMNFKPVLAVTLAALMLTGCATRNAKDIPNEFAKHWQQEAQDRQGYSPAPTDLQPEPRVLLSQSDAALQGKEKALPSQRITLKLQNAGVDAVLRAMANAAGVSLMMAPGIKETTSINVKNARWSDVFLSILNSNGLDWQWQGNILQVVTLAEKQRLTGMMNLNNQLAEAYQAASHTGPLSVQVVNVRYSDAKSLKESLSKFVTRNKDAVIEIDEHNNALILQGTAIEQKRMLALIDHLDRPRPQVLLKAYIVETTKEKARELGVQWGGRFGNRSHTTIGNGDATSSSSSKIGDPSSFRLDYSSLTNAGSAGIIGLTHAGNYNVLEAQLNLMEREGVLNILSSPSITTLDNKMAYTENGEKVPYVSKDSDGDDNVKFEDAVLRLEMTPNVIDASNLKLKVLIKKDEVDSSRSVQGNPYIVKKQTETTLLAKSGETIVISGLTKERGSLSDAGLPGLRDIPGGKYAFGSTNRTTSMEEVLIFITPEILPTREAGNQAARPLSASPDVLAEPPRRNHMRPAEEATPDMTPQESLRRTPAAAPAVLPAPQPAAKPVVTAPAPAPAAQPAVQSVVTPAPVTQTPITAAPAVAPEEQAAPAESRTERRHRRRRAVED